MNAMNSGGVSEDETMSTEMSEDMLEGSKSHPSVNRIKVHL